MRNKKLIAMLAVLVAVLALALPALAADDLVFKFDSAESFKGWSTQGFKTNSSNFANGYFVGAINRVGHEQPWDIGEFYGQSYFCDPRGKMLAVAPRDQDALTVADLDLDVIREVRNTWQFFRDRRPETYGALVEG